MRPVGFGEALPAGARLTLFSEDKPERFFTVIKFWMDKTSGVALALKTGVPTYQVRPWNAVSLFSFVCRLLALLLALAVAPTVTFAGEAAHDQGHVIYPTGRFVVHTWGHLSTVCCPNGTE